MEKERAHKRSVKMRPSEMLPRERMIRDSAQSLNNSELLAILLHTGTAERDVLTLADDILIATGGLEGLLRQNLHSLCEIKGIGMAKACTLMAAVELGRRLMILGQARNDTSVNDAESAARLLRAQLRHREQETFSVIYLDAKHRVLACKTLFVGTVNGASVHPRDIFREAVRLNAVALICGHNHPSGTLTPSTADVLLTKRLQEAAAIIGVEFLDHIIFSDEACLSMREQGMWND